MADELADELVVLEDLMELAEKLKIHITKFQYGSLVLEFQPIIDKPKVEHGPSKEVVERRSKALDNINPQYGHPSLGLID